MNAILVLSTAPSTDDAHQLARTLVEERLAACCSIVPGVSSIYRWQNSVERSDECLMLIKTSREHYEALRTRILSMHPYDVPEILAVNLDAGDPSYLSWLAASLGAP